MDQEYLRKLADRVKQEQERTDTKDKTDLQEREAKKRECPQIWASLKTWLRDTVDQLNKEDLAGASIKYLEHGLNSVVIQPSYSKSHTAVNFSEGSYTIIYTAARYSGKFSPYMEHDGSIQYSDGSHGRSIQEMGEAILNASTEQRA